VVGRRGDTSRPGATGLRGGHASAALPPGSCVWPATIQECGRKITLTTTSKRLSFAGTRMVEPVGEDATRVTFVGGGRAGGMWRLAEPLLAAVGGRRLRTQLGRPKRLLESQP
jgi:hypothetical protein